MSQAEQQHVDAVVGLAGVEVARDANFALPGAAPGNDAAFQVFNDEIGNSLIRINAGFCVAHVGFSLGLSGEADLVGEADFRLTTAGPEQREVLCPHCIRTRWVRAKCRLQNVALEVFCPPLESTAHHEPIPLRSAGGGVRV